MLDNRLKNEILKKMSENNNGNTKNGVAFFFASLREKNNLSQRRKERKENQTYCALCAYVVHLLKGAKHRPTKISCK